MIIWALVFGMGATFYALDWLFRKWEQQRIDSGDVEGRLPF